MKKHIPLKLIAAVAALGAVAPAFAEQWNNVAGGDYNTAANWTPASVPGSGGTATFDAADSPTYTVTTDANITVDRINAAGGDVVTLDLDNGSPLTLAVNQMRVGNSGGGYSGVGNFTLDGGVITVGTVLYVGNNAGAVNDSVLTLTNGASLTVASGVGNNFQIGVSANNANNSLVVQNGADLIINTGGASQSTSLGSAAGAGGNDLTVTGTGSTLSMNTGNSFLVLGAQAGGNAINILNGATATVNTNIRLGASNGGQPGTAGNAIVVDGVGTMLTQTGGSVNVGFTGKSATATDNSITVSNSGVFTTSQSVSVLAGTDNRLEVLSGGVMNLNNATNTLEGRLTVNGGDFNAGGLSVASTGVIQFKDGSVDIAGNLSAAADSHFVFDLQASELTIDVAGTFSVAGTSFIDIGEIEGGLGTYTLFTFGAGSGLANLELGSTPIGFDGVLSFDSDSVNLVVNAVPEPGTAGLIALALAAVTARRRVHRVGRA